MRKELREIFITKTRSEWLDFFAKDDVCLTPVNDLSEIADDTYLNERNLFVNFQLGGIEIKTIGQPIKFSSGVDTNNWVAPQLGEDSYAILKELNLSEEKIHTLIDQKIAKVI
jgi:crotonobetainyl-CoA:carnitine CoA-transferase CaiB-like acyl-CoA transferase